MSLWVTIPFYFARTGDPKAEKKVLTFLDERFSLGLDFAELNGKIKRQSTRIAELRRRSPRIEECINRLETSLVLSDEENIRLVNEVEEFLGTGQPMD